MQIDDQTVAIDGVILAGGRGQRMGGRDKGLVNYVGAPLIAHLIARVAPQVDRLWINANRHADAYAAFGYPVIADRLADFAGPLAGIDAALAVTQADYLFVAACDMPHLPMRIVAELWRALQHSDCMLAVPHDGERLQSMCALYRTGCREALQTALDSGVRKLGFWQEQLGLVSVDCADQAAAFLNMNSPDDLA